MEQLINTFLPYLLLIMTWLFPQINEGTLQMVEGIGILGDKTLRCLVFPCMKESTARFFNLQTSLKHLPALVDICSGADPDHTVGIGDGARAVGMW